MKSREPVADRAGQDCRGQSLVETALILPVLVLFVFAILDLGRGAYAYNVVANAAREAARYGVANPTDDTGILNTACAYATGLEADHLTITVSHPSSEQVRVQVCYVFDVLTPLVSQVVGNGGHITMLSAATMYWTY